MRLLPLGLGRNTFTEGNDIHINNNLCIYQDSNVRKAGEAKAETSLLIKIIRRGCVSN
jgi:hypothetical protein